MTFSYRPAVRDRVALLVAIAGASGSGKTLSALKIARGTEAPSYASVERAQDDGGPQ